MEPWLQVGDDRLVAYFQRYRVENEPDVLRGELLTKPDGCRTPESYFSRLAIADQFAILEWHLRLSAELAELCQAIVSINIHNSMIESEDGQQRLLSLLAAHPVSVTLEFTETYPMPQIDASNRLLRGIRELGHFSALDDFGTGFNEMSLLTDFDFDVIKIDQSLSANLATDPGKQRSLGLLAKILDVLGKDHVVEGVESEDVYQLLVDIGFVTFQGFLFHAPERVTDVCPIVQSDTMIPMLTI